MPEEIIAQKDDLADGGRRLLNIKGIEIELFKIKGRYYAVRNKCPHQGGPVCTGKVTGTVMARANTNWKFQWTREGEIVTCPWHSLEYDIKTGQSLALKNYRLKTYPVKVKDHKVVLQV